MTAKSVREAAAPDLVRLENYALQRIAARAKTEFEEPQGATWRPLFTKGSFEGYVPIPG